MEIRRKTMKIGNCKAKWQIVNESWETRNAWGHKTTLIRNGYDYGEHKVRYYNRTWERYTYETCMRGAVEELYQRELDYYINQYKENNAIIRFKKGEKEKVEKEFEKIEIAKELKKLKKAIQDRKFDK